MTKVLILAGGKGTRLWPLTDDDVRPKPNVYVGGPKRLLEYILDCFVRAGYTRPYIAVQHMENRIMDAFGDGSNFVYNVGGEKVRLNITYTKSPPDKQFKGTADALRKSRLYLADRVGVTHRETQKEMYVTAEEYLGNKRQLEFQKFVDDFSTVVVVPGDILTNFDISDLVRQHQKRGVAATIAGYEIKDVKRIAGKLGTMTLDETGKILTFEEKPENPTSRVVNTGIYVFEASVLDWLDQNEEVNDFGKHLFPEFLREGKEMFAPIMPGYWNDVGEIDNYRATNLDMIDSIDGVDTSSHMQSGEEASRILGNTRHVMISRGCLLGPNSRVANSVLGNDVTVRRDTRLNGCIIYAGSDIGANCRGAIVDGDVVIEKGAQIGRNVTVGKGARIKSDAIIHAGVKIAPGEIVKGEIKGNILRD